MSHKVLVIVGPTASGKSGAAINLAKKYSSEVISADSVQVYKQLDIGSGKVTPDEIGNVQHHLIDVVDPGKNFTTEDYRNLGNKAINKILQNNNLPIIAGGTGFYIDTLVKNIKYPVVDDDHKHQLQDLDVTALQDLANKKIPQSELDKIDTNNPARLRSRLGLWLTHGYIPRPQKINRDIDLEFIWLGINPGKETLHQNITKRTTERLQTGLIDEVVSLLQSGINTDWLMSVGLTYRLVVKYLNGEHSSIEELEKQIIRSEIRYAKRQMTWFKRNKKIKWFKTSNELIDYFE